MKVSIIMSIVVVIIFACGVTFYMVTNLTTLSFGEQVSLSMNICGNDPAVWGHLNILIMSKPTAGNTVIRQLLQPIGLNTAKLCPTRELDLYKNTGKCKDLPHCDESFSSPWSDIGIEHACAGTCMYRFHARL